MYRNRLIIWLFLASVRAKPGSENIACPSTPDNWQYEYFRLHNTLRVLIITDKSNCSELSGAAMSVDVGSWDDPPNYLGLAHLLEHVLLENNDNAEELDFFHEAVLHGGAAWGVTLEQETKYYFQAPGKYLLHLLDRFSGIFKSSLSLNDSLITSEVNGVHMEYERNRYRFGSKFWQVIKHVSNHAHPFHKFDTGNVHSLYQSDLPEKVKDFYQDRYSANMMNLVVFTSEPRPNLKVYISQVFSAIPNRDTERNYYGTVLPFDEYAGRIIIMKCDTCRSTLTMQWQIQSVYSNPQSTTGKLFTQYLGHKENGSLYNFFILNNIATDVEVKLMTYPDYFDLLQISVELTEKGMRQTILVVKVVFQFLDVLKKMNEKQYYSYWQELVAIEQFLFDWMTKDMLEYICFVSSQMRIHTESSDFIGNPRNYAPNFKEFQDVLLSMTPERLLIIISTSNVDEASTLRLVEDFQAHNLADVEVDMNEHSIPLPELDLLEPHYGTPFAIYSIDKYLIWFWSREGDKIKLSLPTPNKFIPDESFLRRYRIDNFFKFPQVNFINPAVRAWVLPRKSFGSVVDLKCIIMRQNTVTTIEQWASAMAYMELVGEILRFRWPSAELMGYKMSFRYNPQSIIFKLNGLGDYTVIKKLIELSFKTLINSNNRILSNPAVFNRVKTYLTMDFSNYVSAMQPIKYIVTHLMRVILWRPYWDYGKVLKEIDKLSLNHILSFGKSHLLKDLSLECLVSGNTDQSKADVLIKAASSVLSPHMAAKRNKKQFYSYRQVILQRGKTYGLFRQNSNPNSVVAVTFQGGNLCLIIKVSSCTIHSIQNRIYLYILDFIMKGACSKHRSRIKQLDYIVECFVNFDGGIGSFTFIAQSEKDPPDQILNSTNQFLEQFFDDVLDSTSFSHDFDEIKRLLRDELSSDYLSVDETWEQIIAGTYHFQIKNQEKSILADVTQSSFKRFYQKLILDSNVRKKLVVILSGLGKTVDTKFDCELVYDNIDQERDDLESACAIKRQ